MSSLALEVIVPPGLDDIVDRLNRVSASREDILLLIGNQARDQTLTRIAATGLAPSGSPWAPLAASTIASKRPGSRIMVDSGRLLSSIAMDVVGDEARLNTPLPYALYHQEGTSRMPARPIFGLEGENLQEVVTTIENFINDILGGTT